MPRVLPFGWEEVPAMTEAEFRNLVGEAIGEASVCWSELPRGVFISTQASDICDRIIEAHRSRLAHAESEIERLRGALKELVLLKDAKEARFSSGIDNKDYCARRSRAWLAARAALAPADRDKATDTRGEAEAAVIKAARESAHYFRDTAVEMNNSMMRDQISAVERLDGLTGKDGG